MWLVLRFKLIRSKIANSWIKVAKIQWAIDNKTFGMKFCAINNPGRLRNVMVQEQEPDNVIRTLLVMQFFLGSKFTLS